MNSVPPPRIRMKRSVLNSDLAVSAIRVTANCKIQVTIRNNGHGGVPDGAYHPSKGAIVQATVNGTGWGGYRLFMVDPQRKLKRFGTSVSYTGLKWALHPGETLTLKVAVLDPNKTVNDPNKANNTLTRGLACAAKAGSITKQAPLAGQGVGPVMRLKPDLTLKNMKITPANPTTLDTIRFSAFFHNSGVTNAPASKAGIKIGGETFPVLFAKPVITAGSSNAIVRLKKLAKAGTYWVRFIADVNNDVNESNENNNMGSIKFTVSEPAPPNLTVTNLTNNASNCLVYKIKNIGGPIPSTIGIRLTKAGITGYSVNNLNLIDPNCTLCQHNGTVTRCNPGSTTGQWFDCIQAKVEVDYTNKLAESNETNNSMEDNALDCGN